MIGRRQGDARLGGIVASVASIADLIRTLRLKTTRTQNDIIDIVSPESSLSRIPEV
jgi:hypothetical protein